MRRRLLGNRRGESAELTPGMIVNLDAFNPASYSGTGTAWNDLSGNNNHYTLQGSPAFSNGAFNFNANSKYALNANTYTLDINTPYTIEFVVNVNAWGSVLGMFQSRTSDGKCAFAWGSTLAGYVVNGIGSGLAGFMNRKTAEGLPTGQWYYLSITYGGVWGDRFQLSNESNLKYNNLNGSQVNPASTTVNTAINQIGRVLSANTANSLMSIFNVYPFVLTPEQQTANFYFYKDRYGI